VKKLLMLAIIIAVVFVLVFAGCSKTTTTPAPAPAPAPTPAAPAPAPQTLNIGAVWGMTGPFSAGELLMVKGEAICKDWINSKGGITVKGQKYLINMIDFDNKSTGDGSVTGAQKLVFQDKVKFVIGDVVGFTIEATRSITDPNKVLYFTSEYDTPSTNFPYTVGAYFAYWASKPALYDYLVKAYPNVKTVTLAHQDELSNKMADDKAIEMIKSHGLTLLHDETYPMGVSDHLPLVTKLVATHPDVIDFNMESNVGAADIVKNARQLGFKGPLLYNSPTDINSLISMIGNPAYSTDFILPAFDPNTPNITPLLTQIIKLWDNAYHTPFYVDALRGWDPLYCVVQAIEKAQSLDPADVVKALQTMDTIDTAEGPAKIGGQKTFGFKSMVLPDCPITRVMNGKAEFIGFTPVDVP